MIFNKKNIFRKLCLLPIEYLYVKLVLCGYFILAIF